jgi:hypothetical protein
MEYPEKYSTPSTKKLIPTIYSSKNSSKNTLATRVFLLLSVLLLFFLLFQITLFLYGRDQGIYAVIGRTIVQGGLPYKDAWDFKPPAIYYIYALSRIIFGDSMHAVRIFEALGLLSMVFAFTIYSKRHFTVWYVGIIAGMLAVLSHVQLDFWDTAQPESFGAIVLSWALVCATYQSNRNDSRWFLKQFTSWFMSGILFALAGLLKPLLGFGIFFSIGAVCYSEWLADGTADRSKQLVMVILSFLLGALATITGCVIFFILKCAGADTYNIFFKFVPNYTALGLEKSSMWLLLVKTVYKWLFSFSLINSIGMMLFFLLPPLSAKENKGEFHIIGILIPQLLGVALQAKFFNYHYGAILPFTALLAVWGFWKIWEKSTLKWLFLAVFFFLIIWQMIEYRVIDRGVFRLSALLNKNTRTYIYDTMNTKYDVDFQSNRLTAEWLAKNTPVNLPVYIWGFEPIIYDLAHRSASSKYIYNVPQRAAWIKDISRKTLMEELSAKPPSAIVVVHHDELSWVTGSNLDSAEELKGFLELSVLLKNNYQYVISFRDLDLYVKKNIADSFEGSRHQ